MTLEDIDLRADDDVQLKDLYHDPETIEDENRVVYEAENRGFSPYNNGETYFIFLRI